VQIGGSDAALLAKCAQLAISINEDVVMACVNELVRLGHAFIVAPNEADSQLVGLFREGIIDAVMSEDMDLIGQGCDQIYNMKGEKRLPVIADSPANAGLSDHSA
jgi:5'-3' exonuclease